VAKLNCHHHDDVFQHISFVDAFLNFNAAAAAAAAAAVKRALKMATTMTPSIKRLMAKRRALISTTSK
jgi:hypothetical protein